MDRGGAVVSSCASRTVEWYPDQSSGELKTVQERVRVSGKFFTRNGQKVRIKGVTYGPFTPNERAEPFPGHMRVREDFSQMCSVGINAIRTYHLPPQWLLGLADEFGLLVLIDVPWAKHLCFLETTRAQRDARTAIQHAVDAGREHSCILGYSICNEIPPNIVRWHGTRRVERFLGELADLARQRDPECLVTSASFPPTEYLDLSFADFATFNVYLHDRETFRRYLFRLQNLVGDRPLMLGELGMDTLRHGEDAQSEFLTGHFREMTLMGLAGAFVFSWTDEWHTGGFSIQDWAFGITTADRRPKKSCTKLGIVFAQSPAELLRIGPRVSVVVCTYNGGATLHQCLESLLALDYPDYEIIVVDDGSTDNTPEILERFPAAKTIRQTNQGLSVARNVGLEAATGEVVAYTDSDCFVDPDWLSHLVYQFQRSDAAAVGGPNLTPDDGWLAACVAAAPGQPTHILESDQVAEHIPGCNMAFRREALNQIGGFDPQYRKAGDDVDVCWRLQQAGHWITFAPGAMVWHHRRQTPRAFFRQQRGYGEAEALLHFKHPDKFNARGDSKWRGVIYGGCLQGVRLSRPSIYRGTFATGLFQCIYQPEPAHWVTFPTTLEWHVLTALIAMSGILWPTGIVAAITMLSISWGVAALQASQARLPASYDGVWPRMIVMFLCYLQPLVRSGQRYRTRFFHRLLTPTGGMPQWREAVRFPLGGTRKLTYWTEAGVDRVQLIHRLAGSLEAHRCGAALDTGWSDWDLEIPCNLLTRLRISTAQEDHGGNKRLIRVRCELKPSWMAAMMVLICLLVAAGVQFHWSIGLLGLLAFGVVLFGGWYRGARYASGMMGLFDQHAAEIGLVSAESEAMGH